MSRNVPATELTDAEFDSLPVEDQDWLLRHVGERFGGRPYNEVLLPGGDPWPSTAAPA